MYDSGPNGFRLTFCFFFICTWEVKLGFYVLPVTVLSQIPLVIKPRNTNFALLAKAGEAPIPVDFEGCHVVATKALGLSCAVAWSFIGLAPILTRACGTAHIVYRVNNARPASLESSSGRAARTGYMGLNAALGDRRGIWLNATASLMHGELQVDGGRQPIVERPGM